MLNKTLDQLIEFGDIASYHYDTEEGMPGTGSREYEILIITFPSGRQLNIKTFCSGTNENTCMFIK